MKIFPEMWIRSSVSITMYQACIKIDSLDINLFFPSITILAFLDVLTNKIKTKYLQNK